MIPLSTIQFIQIKQMQFFKFLMIPILADWHTVSISRSWILLITDSIIWCWYEFREMVGIIWSGAVSTWDLKNFSSQNNITISSIHQFLWQSYNKFGGKLGNSCFSIQAPCGPLQVIILVNVFPLAVKVKVSVALLLSKVNSQIWTDFTPILESVFLSWNKKYMGTWPMLSVSFGLQFILVNFGQNALRSQVSHSLSLVDKLESHGFHPEHSSVGFQKAIHTFALWIWLFCKTLNAC